MLCLLLNRPIGRRWRHLLLQRFGRPVHVTVFSTLRTTSSHSCPASQFSRERLICVNSYDRLSAADQLQLSATSQLSETRDAMLRWYRTSGSRQQAQRDGSSGRRGSQPGSEQDPDKPPDEGPVTQMFKTALWMAVVYWSVSQLSSVLYGNSQAEQILRPVSWHEFVHQMLARGEVQELIVHPDSGQVTVVLHEQAVLRGRRVDYNIFHLNVPDTNQFEQRLREAEAKIGVSTEDGVPVIYDRSTDTTSRLITVLLLTGLFGYMLSRGRMKLSSSMGGLGRLSRAKFTIVDSLAGEGRGVKFSDVAGLEEAKQEVIEFVDYLKRPEYYRNLGAKVPKGALLLGPPGCGKTLLAKAVATEGGVPFLTMNGSEFIEMIGGLGAARVRDLFKEARKRSPCIIFIDEIDAIGRARGAGSSMASGGSGEMEQTLNQLLVEMDGMSTTSGVIMLASTNRADLLDKALLRPGRFDRHITIDLPTLLERQQIFNHHLGSIVLEHEPQHYSLHLAKLTPGFSGADIMNVCNESALKAARDGGKKVTGADLDYAVERVVGGTEKRSHVLSPAERRVVAVHESGHALVGWLLQHTDALLKVSIVPRTQGVLGFARYTPSDQKLHSTEQLFDRMCMALGGRVAESMVFNTITDGARDDLQRVTKMAYAQIRQFGMSEELGVISFDDNASGGGRRPYSKHTANIIDVTARRLVARAYHTTDRLLRDNKHKLALMSDALMSRDALTYHDVVELIGNPTYGNKRRVTSEEFEGALSAHRGVDESPQSPSSVESPQESTDSPSSPSQRDDDDMSDPTKS